MGNATFCHRTSKSLIEYEGFSHLVIKLVLCASTVVIIINAHHRRELNNESNRQAL